MARNKPAGTFPVLVCERKRVDPGEFWEMLTEVGKNRVRVGNQNIGPGSSPQHTGRRNQKQGSLKM